MTGHKQIAPSFITSTSNMNMQEGVVLQGIPVVDPGILSEVYKSPHFFSGSVWIPGEISDPSTISALSQLNSFFVVQRHEFFHNITQSTYIQFIQRELDMTSPDLLPAKLNFILNREYHKWYIDYAKGIGMSVPHHDWYVHNFGSFVPSPLEPLFYDPFLLGIIVFLLILLIGLVFILRRRSYRILQASRLIELQRV